MIWIVILALGVLGVFLYWQQQQGKSLPFSSPKAALPSLERTVFTLEIGDIVQHLDIDWIVEGKLTYSDQGYTWLEYLLQDGANRQWLSVEEDDIVEIALLEPITTLEIGSHPPAQLTFADQTYQQKGAGTAQMTHQGSTLNRTAQTCQYFDYQGPEGKVLSIENWSGDIEVTVGQKIHPSVLTLLPGDGRRIYGA
ncbi:MAG: DUF4178 domain-containing protein [Acaryochloridaceae cyanobacterium SU_2_1]|nr:DUF4178 domain-containing protein [Acaryochloridaceae cyanobacterium SU_2_1]